MWKSLKRRWKYLVARTDKSFNEKADPSVQLEQAIADAQDQHRRLKEQAANVIANQKQAEMRLNRSMDEYAKLNGNTRQAVLMADQAAKAGDTKKAGEYAAAAETFANRLITMENEMEQSKTLALQASQAAEQAKAAVAQNSSALQKKLAERQKLLSQLDQAKMQEQMNRAMSTLNESVGLDTPTFAQVRDKIEARYAKATGMAELTEQSVESHILEIEQASMNIEAQARLSEIRASLGLDSGADSPSVTAGQSAPQSMLDKGASIPDPAVPTQSSAEPRSQPQG